VTKFDLKACCHTPENPIVTARTPLTHSKPKNKNTTLIEYSIKQPNRSYNQENRRTVTPKKTNHWQSRDPIRTHSQIKRNQQRTMRQDQRRAKENQQKHNQTTKGSIEMKTMTKSQRKTKETTTTDRTGEVIIHNHKRTFQQVART